MDAAEMTVEEFYREWNNESDTISVRTSGSTGTPKLMLVEKRRMVESAEMTCRFLGLTSRDSALLCMPLKYIAGKMVLVRCLVSGMKLVSVPPSGHPLKNLKEIPSFAAMVPMQVYNTLAVEEEAEKLKKVRNLIIGGGPVNESLAGGLKDFPNAVWSTYGMTETLSHIAMRRLSGPDRSEYYTPLEGISLSVNDRNCLCISAPKICEGLLHTNDVVEFDESHGRFRVIGRMDNVINSGGIKIQIEDVENAITPLTALRFAVTKQTDRKFGEIVVLAVAGPCTASEMNWLKDIVEAKLPKYWQPRRYCVVDVIPVTETGKVARKALYDMING